MCCTDVGVGEVGCLLFAQHLASCLDGRAIEPDDESIECGLLARVFVAHTGTIHGREQLPFFHRIARLDQEGDGADARCEKRGTVCDYHRALR